MRLFAFSGILIFVRAFTLVECLPFFALPSITRFSDISSEDSISADEIADDFPTPFPLSSTSSFPLQNEYRSFKQTEELIFQDDADLEDVLRELLQDLNRHEALVTAEKIDTRSRTLIEVYDPYTGESEGYLTKSKSSTRALVPYPYLLERTLQKMALDSTKTQIAYNIIREKQGNFHPSSNVYKVLEKSVSILLAPKPYYERPPPPGTMRYKRRSSFVAPLTYPSTLPRKQRRRTDERYFKRKSGRMSRYLKNKLAKFNRKLMQKPLQTLFKYNS